MTTDQRWRVGTAAVFAAALILVLVAFLGSRPDAPEEDSGPPNPVEVARYQIAGTCPNVEREDDLTFIGVRGYDYEFTTPDGTLLWVSYVEGKIQDDGQPQRLIDTFSVECDG